MYFKSSLENGIRVIGRSMPSRRSVSLGIWFNVGGRHESPEYKGISHFLEHLVFKGSSKYSCRQLKESIEGVGGSLNGFTSEELTCYLVKIPDTYLRKAFDILTDMSLHPKLMSQDINKERAVILEEIKMYKDLPQSYVLELLDSLLWPDQLLGMSVLGTEQSVARIGKKELSSYQRKYYTPLNMVVSAAGSLRKDDLINIARKNLSGLRQGSQSSFPMVDQRQDNARVKVVTRPTEQAHLALGFHALKRSDPRRYALDLLHIILGANMSSRLFNEIREKRGLAYEIGTSIRRFHDTGAFIIHAGIDVAKTREAIKLILNELVRIRDQKVREEELNRAKDYYIGQLGLSLEDTAEQMLFIGESMVTMDKVLSPEHIVKEIRRVTSRAIADLCKDIFRPSKVNISLVTPQKYESDDLVKLMKL